MRYFLLTFGVLVVLVMLIAGKRGEISRKPPLYVFPDMDRQLKLRPMQPNAFFTNGISSQLPVAGTIARSKPIQTPSGPVYSYEDAPVNTGRVTGTTNFVAVNPLPITAQLLHRGQERFAIYCSPCHGMQGDGNGVVKRVSATITVANLHTKNIVDQPDGEIFNTITHGKNLMGAYGPNVTIEDRWAIIAYLRALQLSQLGMIDDVPQELRATLK